MNKDLAHRHMLVAALGFCLGCLAAIVVRYL